MGAVQEEAHLREQLSDHLHMRNPNCGSNEVISLSLFPDNKFQIAYLAKEGQSH